MKIYVVVTCIFAHQSTEYAGTDRALAIEIAKENYDDGISTEITIWKDDKKIGIVDLKTLEDRLD